MTQTAVAKMYEIVPAMFGGYNVLFNGTTLTDENGKAFLYSTRSGARQRITRHRRMVATSRY